MAFLEGIGLKKHFGGLGAINDLEFRIERGEIIGLIGPNGAGKTTLLNLISGSLKPSEGEILFKEERISGLKPHIICRKGIARTFQSVKLFSNSTVYENVLLGSVYGRQVKRSGRDDDKEVRMLLDFMGIEAKSDIFVKDLNAVDQKMVELTRALATKPDLLLLDEVIAGLNPGEISRTCEMIRKINSQGTTIIMVEHVMDVIMSLSQRVIVLNYGVKIAEGRPDEISKDEKVIECYLGEDTEC